MRVVDGLGHPCIHCAHTSRGGMLGTSYLVVSYFKLLSSVCHCKRVTCVKNNFKINVRGALRTTICNVPIVFKPGCRGFVRTIRLLRTGKTCSVGSCSRLGALLSHFQASRMFLHRANAGTKCCIADGTKTARGVVRVVGFWLWGSPGFDSLW